MPGGGHAPEYSWDETKPAGSTQIQDGDNWNRSNQMHIDNMLAVEHYSMGDDPDASEDDFGRHDYITLKEQGAKVDLSGSTDRHALYTKSDGLYFEKDDATEVQLIAFDTDQVPTENIEPHDIPSGEIILFEKNTAVTGYTLQTDKDDMVVYITKGSAAGGATGATDKSGGTWNQPNHTHTGPSHTHSYVVWRGGYSTAGAASNGYLCLVYTGGSTPYYQSGANRSGTTGSGGNGNTGSSSTATSYRPPGRNFTRQARD